jgi:hypothetical protein
MQARRSPRRSPPTSAARRSITSSTIDHIFDLTLAAKQAKEPDKQFDDAKVAAARKQLHDELEPKCGTFDHASYQCLMAATSMDQANACASN